MASKYAHWTAFLSVPARVLGLQSVFQVPGSEPSPQSADPGYASVLRPQFAFPGPASVLSPQPDVFCAAGQRDAAEKRLKNLERLLIRADPANKPHQVHLDPGLVHRQTDRHLIAFQMALAWVVTTALC